MLHSSASPRQLTMLISTGPVPASEPWNILEVSQNQQPDLLAIRLTKQIKKSREKVEALVPMVRTPSGDCSWIVEHVYIRGANGSLRMIAQTAGIECVRPEIADAEWIAKLMRKEKQAEPKEIPLGTFVRVLAGPAARLCGSVTALSPQAAVVIELFTKAITVYASQQHLQPVKCDPACHVFFYRPDFF